MIWTVHTFKARRIVDDCRECGQRYAHPAHYVDPLDPANCRDCGAPFNNANPSRSGLCAECEAD